MVVTFPLACKPQVGEPNSTSASYSQNGADESTELIRAAEQNTEKGLSTIGLSTLDILVAVVQLLSRVQLFVAPWTVAHQAPLSSTISWSLFKLVPIELVMPSNHLILCCPPSPLALDFPQH